MGCAAYLFVFFRNRNSPRPTTGAFRVRATFDFVDTPLNSTKKSMNARQKPLLCLLTSLTSPSLRFGGPPAGCGN